MEFITCSGKKFTVKVSKLIKSVCSRQYDTDIDTDRRIKETVIKQGIESILRHAILVKK